MSDLWGADTPISLPEPPAREVRQSYGGFGFTDAGLCHDVAEGDLEDLMAHCFSPVRPPADEG